ncbi:MAG: 4-oxalocrotonate tautomerase DmpI [Deferrisomatales bacterium]|nr:4-oxalocrotonate tautomerase DmpI [Deferrisomatales bacterium]
MPTLTIEGPPIPDLGRKRALVKAATAAAVEAYGLPAEIIVVVIKENAPENVGVGGHLIADRD